MYHKMRWTAQRVARYLDTLAPLVYRRQVALPDFRFHEMDGPEARPLVDPGRDDGAWETVAPKTYWAAWRTDFMLRTSFAVPTDWDDGAPVALYLPLGVAGDFSHPEALAYIDGAAYAGCDLHHQKILLRPEWRDGQSHALALHGWTGNGDGVGRERGSRPLMGLCALVQIDVLTRDFITSARVALGVIKSISEEVPAHGRLLNALADAFNQVDLHEPIGAGFYESIRWAHQVLQDGIAAAGAPLDVTLVAAGHAHIDVAWLWTLAQTRRKAGRTFHTVQRLMEQFPAYHFTQSQPQLYDYVRQDYPELFTEIGKRVGDGRWEPIGGMWVEADCNLSGAESLARQFLLGRTFFREHFGPAAESPVLWLPDVFGYAWALPQLIKQAGLEYFFTIKIGWSQYNRLPYDSFWWQGLDGTRVLTHFSTTPTKDSYASTYNAPATPESIIGTWQNFQQKEQQHTLLMSYGYGDGGGGPTREMLENLQETASFPATPRVKQGKVIEFFRAMEAEAGDSLPTWNGELYLELHRGTYTNQSRNKRANRKSEFLLHDAEFLASYAAAIAGNSAGYSYPQEELGRAWELVCLNQFHDIIPGSSITQVYVDSLQQYGEIKQIGTAVKDEALAALARRIKGDLLLVNPTSFAQNATVLWCEEMRDGQVLLREGTAVQTQRVDAGVLIDAGGLPPYSISPLTLAEAPVPSLATDLSVSTTHLENQFLRVDLNEVGDIVRITDKVNARELLPPQAVANQLQAFEDRPLNWEAWDIDIFYDDKMVLADPADSIEVVETGPLRATLRIKRRILNSSFTQTISLLHNQPQLDFDTHIDWQERRVLLKVAFPVDILAPTATYEIQWGNVERPTHRNTSWDWARFETCAQKWVDLSEGDYGVSLLNDCKYGHDVRDNVMRLSLLRGSTSPDPVADLGEHRFAYSLRSHHGRWGEQTLAAAYALNDPCFAYRTSGPAESGSQHAAVLVACDRSNVVIETIKQAEDGRGLIVRLFESQRRRGPFTLTTGFALRGVWRTNLLEDDLEAVSFDGNQIQLSVNPYEIVTLRLEY